MSTEPRRTPWKVLFMVWISFTLIFPMASAQTVSCGEYEFKGVLRKVEGRNVLKLYESSLKEVTFSLAPDLADLAELNLNRAVILKGKMLAPIEEDRGRIESTLTAKQLKTLSALERTDIQPTTQDPLDPAMDSGMKLIKKLPCKGSESSSMPQKKPSKK